MKLVYPKYNIQIHFEENISQILLIENPTVLQECLSELWKQASGEPGEWLLSEGVKEYSLGKSAEVIFNLFALDLNNKKVLGRLYQEMEQNMLESCVEEMGAVNAEIVQMLDRISLQLPYILKYDLELNPVGLMKLYNVGLDEQEMSFMEKICMYIRNIHQLCRTELVVFLNLKQLLSEEQLLELYKFCYYEKVAILDIESVVVHKCDSEHFTVLDKDLCLISY